MSLGKVRALVLRADGGSGIGMGHLMRCLALAQQCLAEGGQPIFVVHRPPKAFTRRLGAEGISWVPSEGPAGSIADAEGLSELGVRRKASWIVLDGYHFDSRYRGRVRRTGLRLVYLDDSQRRVPANTDVLVNQNLHASGLVGSSKRPTRILAGPRYVLLRREFRQTSRLNTNRDAPVSRILVSLGGEDPGNATLTILKGLALEGRGRFQLTAVAGALNANIDSLRNWISRHDSSINLICSTDDMSTMLAAADLAITAAGTTVWELAFMGVPAIITTIARNQVPIARSVARAGLALNLGPARGLTPGKVAAAVRRIAGDPDLRRRLIRRGRGLVDGLGAQRVLRAMARVGGAT